MKKILNVMRCLVGSDWGADRTAIKALYTGLVRSVFDYGCVVYGSAASSNLKKLDKIQHQALQLCTSTLKTTPTAALQVEMGEIPLEIRRTQLAVTYWIKLQGHKLDHPTQNILKPCWEKEKKGNKKFWVDSKTESCRT